MDEKVLVVSCAEGRLVAAGWAWRSCVHLSPRVPHASVLIVPRLKSDGRVVLHKRSHLKEVSPGDWDFCGGHVCFDESIDRCDSLVGHLAAEARRESLEEIYSLSGTRLDISLSLVGRAGGIVLDSPSNLELATLFIATVSSDSDIGVRDGLLNGVIQNAETLVGDYKDLRDRYEAGDLACAVGASAIFKCFKELNDGA